MRATICSSARSTSSTGSTPKARTAARSWRWRSIPTSVGSRTGSSIRSDLRLRQPLRQRAALERRADPRLVQVGRERPGTSSALTFRRHPGLIRLPRKPHNNDPGIPPHRQGRTHGVCRCCLRRRRPVEGARGRMGQDAGLGQPARHRLARHHPHPALHRSDQREIDQSGAEHPGRAQARLGRGGARSRPRAVSRRADARRAEAVAVARDVGVGWCAARHLTHTGAIGYFALQARRPASPASS